jgi:hypothetical protein
MKYIVACIQILVIFSFLCHSYIIMTPAIDEIGFFGVVLHAILATLSVMLFFTSAEVYKDHKENKNE